VKGNAVLYAEMTPPPNDEAAFNTWYDTHHAPSHVQGVPGFLAGRRYKHPTGPGYLAVYELTTPETLKTEDYRSRKYTPDPPTKAMLSRVTGFARYIAVETGVHKRPEVGDGWIDAQICHPAFFTVPAERRAAFDAWYVDDLIPTVLRCKEWLCVRRLRVVENDPHPFTDMVLHYCADMSVEAAPERKASIDSPVRAALAKEPWFKVYASFFVRRPLTFVKGR